MAAPRLLLKTDLASVRQMTLDGRPVQALHERLAGLLRARAGEKAAALFAEPVIGAGAISWYGEAAGDPQPLSALPAGRRAGAEQALRQALASLEGALADPELGPLLRRALVLPGPDSILALDDAVFLTGWGLAPEEVGAEPAAMAGQVRRILGPYAPFLATVPDGFLAAGPAAPVAAPPSSSPGPASTAAPPRRPPPPPVAAAGQPRAQPWLLPLLAATALLFLGLGFWLAWLHLTRDMAAQPLSASLVDDAATRRAIEQQRETNAALEQELERMRRLAATPNVCLPEGPLGLNPPPERQPVRPEVVPPAVPQQQGQAPAPFTGSLAQLLEHAAVMVIGAGPEGVGHSTGFFVAGDTILTNTHVVEGLDPERIFVVSAAISRPIRARLAAMTRAPDGSRMQPGNPDIAILRLPQPIPGAQPLSLSTVAEKLNNVVAAGYPISVVQVEQGMRDLAEGRIGTPPELVLTTGTISTIQRLPSGLTVMPHTADISPGNSGGPLVDSCGRVVGINTFVSRATAVADRVKYAQKVDSLLPWLREQGLNLAVREEACQPVVPGLAAQPAPPGGSPGAAAPPPAAQPASPSATPGPAAPAAPAATPR